MHILDIFLLAFALTILLAIARARSIGTLPTRGLRRLAQSESMPQLSERSQAGARINASKPDSFRGILAHHDGPMRLVPPNQTTS